MAESKQQEATESRQNSAFPRDPKNRKSDIKNETYRERWRARRKWVENVEGGGGSVMFKGRQSFSRSFIRLHHHVVVVFFLAYVRGEVKQVVHETSRCV